MHSLGQMSPNPTQTERREPQQPDGAAPGRLLPGRRRSLRQSPRGSRINMEKLLVFSFILVLLTISADTSPILNEKEAKQILRTRREDRPRKAGFPDEPMRDIKGTVDLAGLDSLCARLVEVARGFPLPMVIAEQPRRIHLAATVTIHHGRGTPFSFVRYDGHNKSKPAQEYYTVPVNNREHMLYLQRLEQRSEEQFLEHWLNPHCFPHCNRDLVHPV